MTTAIAAGLRRLWRALELLLTVRDLAGVVLALAPWALSLAAIAALASLRWLSDPANAIALGFVVLVAEYLVMLWARAQLRRSAPVDLEVLRGPGPSRVAVRNRSDRAVAVHAKAHIIDRRHDRGGQPLRTGSYVVPWEHAAAHRIGIASGDSATLVVGRCQFWYEQALAQMDLPQVTPSGEALFETSRWNMYPNEPLPEYDVELSIFVSGYPQPHTERFTLRPARYTGPLELQPLVR